MTGGRAEFDVSAFALPFVMFCDEHGLTLSQGLGLAERCSDELLDAAAMRSDYLPPELLDTDDAYNHEGS